MLDPTVTRSSGRSPRLAQPWAGTGQGARAARDAENGPAPSDSGARRFEARSERGRRRSGAGEASGQGRERHSKPSRQRAQQISSSASSSIGRTTAQSILLMSLPNLPHASVPVGKSEADNVVVRRARGAANVRLRAAAALGSRGRTRHSRLRARDEDVWRAVSRADRRRRAIVARADQLHARFAHARARISGGRAAVSRQSRRRSTGTGNCRSSKPTSSRSPVTGTCISCRRPRSR